MVDVITTGQMLWPWVNVYFNLSSGMLYRTSSHICGRWYLPTFLFRDGLLTLIYRASLYTTVYSKPTHTDQYLHWDSLHPVSSKCSVVGTLHHRTKTICSDQQLLKEEEDHLTKALMKCKYPRWALNRVRIKMNSTGPQKQNQGRTHSAKQHP